MHVMSSTFLVLHRLGGTLSLACARSRWPLTPKRSREAAAPTTSKVSLKDELLSVMHAQAHAVPIAGTKLPSTPL